MRDPNNLKDKGWLSNYTPAKMTDNKYIDPSYASSFSGLPEELGRALQEGDWDLVVGSFFGDIWKRDLHFIRPFDMPQHWTKFRSFDCGDRLHHLVLVGGLWHKGIRLYQMMR